MSSNTETASNTGTAPPKEKSTTDNKGNTVDASNTVSPPSAQDYAKLQAEVLNAILQKMHGTYLNQGPHSLEPEQVTAALSRHWNNKGNSMESLILRMVDTGHYGLIWYTAYICWHATYCDSGYWFSRRV
jgi:hypothetical protein